MKELNHEVEIHASAERVWQLLTDFDRFPQWNPFMHRASGEPKTGARLEVTSQASGAARTVARPTVLNVEPNRELRLDAAVADTGSARCRTYFYDRAARRGPYPIYTARDLHRATGSATRTAPKYRPPAGL